MKTPGNKEKLLIVDDDALTQEVLRRNLKSEGYEIYTASSVPMAIDILGEKVVDLVITDLKMPGVSGLDLVRHVRENLPDMEVMMITGYATVEGAVEAVKTGAEEYLAKPFTDDELIVAVARTLEKLHRRRAASAIVKKPKCSYGLIGESSPMLKVYEEISRAALTTATVLITGESGTGKELVARAIHYGGPRASAPFVPVNCGGIPDTLFESELFGHVKGAFTGATETRAGFFQTADGGTIFLDEISEVALPMQVKLLRVIQEKEVYMVGSTKPQKVDVRIVAATNKELQNLVDKGDFREDLFFRINVLTINLPPLRERGDDILLLANHFVGRFAGEFGKPAPSFSDAALEAMKKYDWPGNVRELENVVQRLIVMCEGDAIDVSDLPSLMRFAVSHAQGLDRTLAEIEAEYIKNVVASVKGNKSQAARILGIDRKTLREKLKDSEDQGEESA